MGHIPVGMEMFSAADEEQWATIKREIDRSDYYVIIAAHRYGSTIKAEDGISYTEKEFDYAVATGVPRIGFIIDPQAQWTPEHIESGVAKRRLDAFKTKIRGKMVDFWVDAADLGLKVAISLPKLIARSPRPGWQRSNEDGERAVKALSHLIEENAALREEVERLRALSSDKIPILDCQFVDEAGVLRGSSHELQSPNEEVARDFIEIQKIEVNSLVIELDNLCRIKSENDESLRRMPAVAKAINLPNLLTQPLSDQYTFYEVRLERVLTQCETIGSRLPEQEWIFNDLRYKLQLMVSHNLQFDPDSGSDLSKYDAFVKLETLLSEIFEQIERLKYAENHKRISLKLLNEGRISAESLTIHLNFDKNVSIGVFDLDVFNRPDVAVDNHYLANIDLIVPQDSADLPIFVVGINSDMEQLDFTVRITGRNLPEAKVLPMSISIKKTNGSQA